MKDPCEGCNPTGVECYHIGIFNMPLYNKCCDCEIFKKRIYYQGYLTGLAEGIEIGLQAGMEIEIMRIRIWLNIAFNECSTTFHFYKFVLKKLAAELRQEG